MLKEGDRVRSPDRRRRRLSAIRGAATASALRTDVMRGYVSLQAARDIYGLND